MRARSGTPPTIRLIVLGKRLQDLRKRAGKSLDDAAAVLDVSSLTIRRMENGQVGWKIPYVKDLLATYGVVDESEVENFLELAREANKPGWWYRHREALPEWFRAYVALEEAANVIRAYEPHYIPGLLQTEEYARAILLAGSDGNSADADRKVAVRMERQKLLARPDAPTLWVVMDETVFRRPIASAEVMRAQIDRLIEVIAMPNVTLQIIPFSTGRYPGMYGPFYIFRFPHEELQDIVYVENLVGAVYLDEYDDVTAFQQVLDRMSTQALPARRTEGALGDLRKEL